MMKNYNQIIRHLMIGLALLSALGLSGAFQNASAQDGTSAQPKGGRDPFVKYKPPVKPKVIKNVSIPVEPPPVQVRIDNYKAAKLAAMKAQKPAPKATTALLLSEMQVMGIFRTPRGYAAMVEATPIKLSYVIYPGEVFYDGQLVAIEENRLVFRREKLWSDGKRELAVEIKPLRQVNAVADSLAATKASGNSSASNAPASDPSADQDKQ